MIALLGTTLGTARDRYRQRADQLKNSDVSQLSIPGRQITIIVVRPRAAVLAAAIPARRASRLDVLKAVSTSSSRRSEIAAQCVGPASAGPTRLSRGTSGGCRPTSARLSVDDGVATITLNRPGKRNALWIEVRDLVSDALDALAADDEREVRRAHRRGRRVLRRVRPDEFRVEDPAFQKQLWASSDRFHHTVLCFPLPLVASINGPALAGGFDLAVMCDIRIAVEHRTVRASGAGVEPGRLRAARRARRWRGRRATCASPAGRRSRPRRSGSASSRRWSNRAELAAATAALRRAIAPGARASLDEHEAQGARPRRHRPQLADARPLTRRTTTQAPLIIRGAAAMPFTGWKSSDARGEARRSRRR